MAGISLQSSIIYGPIFSRRLGRSLGINLLTTSQKVCSFDCIYCQYGRTAIHTQFPSRDLLPSIEEVLSAVEKALQKPRTIQYLTFSGNGEATIHPDFLEIVQGVKALRDRYRPEVKLAILSNSSCVKDPDVLAGFNLMDVPMMKLDAGDDETVNAINQPVRSLKVGEIIEGLKSLSKLIIQSVLIDGEVSNIRNNAYETWAGALCDLKPANIHIYSIERPPANNSVKRVLPAKLQNITEDLHFRFGLKAEAFWH